MRMTFMRFFEYNLQTLPLTCYNDFEIVMIFHYDNQ